MCLTTQPVLRHHTLKTAFTGVEHALSTVELPVAQYRGIKYANIPMRFRPSTLVDAYGARVDATEHGPICPQPVCRLNEPAPESGEALDLLLVPDEFECLNLNVTCPRYAKPSAHLPVMLWIHGGDRGSGSSWMYDGGALVQKSMKLNKPIILVTINYRLGIFGSAASPALQEDNASIGATGVGNYGLRDQQTALEWVHRFISEFGGDPENVTLFGESTGASDVLCHLHSAANAKRHLFQRAIVQSPTGSVEQDAVNVYAAGRFMSKAMSLLGVSSLDELRGVDALALAALPQRGFSRATDDGVFFRPNWKIQDLPLNSDSGHRPMQPLIIGDSSLAPLAHSAAVSLWNAGALVRRARAITQSLSKASTLLRAYDISSYTLDEDLPDRVLELVQDARWAWPTDRAARRFGFGAAGQHNVFRFVWDQDTPADADGAGTASVVATSPDIAYLFDNVPAPDDALDSPFDSAVFDDDWELEEEEMALTASPVSSRSGSLASVNSLASGWEVPIVDAYAFARVRDAVQERWIAFAHGERPWAPTKVFVFGPEGECGERTMGVFEARRRVKIWRESLESLGMDVVSKAGVEFAEGPCL